MPVPAPKTAEDETWLTRPLRAQLLALQKMCIDTLRQVPLHLSPRFVLLMEVRAQIDIFLKRYSLSPFQVVSILAVGETRYVSTPLSLLMTHAGKFEQQTGDSGARRTGCRHGKDKVCCSIGSLACISVGVAACT